MALSDIKWPELESDASAAEWAQRTDLAAACRLVALHGWDDLVFTRLSARVPGPENHFLVNPGELMLEEVTASSLVKVDAEGIAVTATPYRTDTVGFALHSAIHTFRASAGSVMVLYTPDCQAVSAMTEGLLPLTRTAMVVTSDLAYHDYKGTPTDLYGQASLVAELGARNTMILRNHGALAVGETVGECFVRLYFLERACQAQVRAMAAGRAALSDPPAGVADKVARQSSGKSMQTIARDLAWPALLRKLDRIDPGFRR